MSTAIETETLEGLDFEISCQTTYVYLYFGGTRELDACGKTATHTATVHKVSDCTWAEKFLCDEHAAEYRDQCQYCLTVPRIKDCQHLGTHT